MSSHDLDLVGFVAGTFLLICAAGAIGLRTGSLGLGDAPEGAWLVGALLLAVGLVGLLGSLWSTRRSAAGTAAAAGPGDGSADSALAEHLPGERD